VHDVGICPIDTIFTSAENAFWTFHNALLMTNRTRIGDLPITLSDGKRRLF
jgi:hypothetical protein